MLLLTDGYTTQKMLLKWKKGFDQSKVRKSLNLCYLYTSAIGFMEFQTFNFVSKMTFLDKVGDFFHILHVLKVIKNLNLCTK